jgi:hypothetical protein
VTISKNCTENCPLEKGLASTFPCGFHYKKTNQLLFDAKDYLRIGTNNCPLEKGLGSTCPMWFSL